MVERNVMDLNIIGRPRSKWSNISPGRDTSLCPDYESIKLPWEREGGPGSRTSYRVNPDSPSHFDLPMDRGYPGERRYADVKPHRLPAL